MKVFDERKWALMSTKEAKELQFGCDFCEGIIEEAEKLKRPVIAWQTSGTSPLWEIVGVWGNKVSKNEKDW
jgi:hypothetical protein